MAAPIDLRNDFDSVSLRRLAKRTRDATQSRRLLALAEVYDGGSRTDASRIGGVGLQIIRDWVLRFNARAKITGPVDATQSRRLLALAEVYDGGSRTDASRIGGVGLQIIRDWVLRFTPADRRAGRWEVTGRTLEAQRRSPPRTGGGC